MLFTYIPLEFGFDKTPILSVRAVPSRYLFCGDGGDEHPRTAPPTSADPDLGQWGGAGVSAARPVRPAIYSHGSSPRWMT